MTRNRKPTTRPPRRRPQTPPPSHERAATCAIDHVREVGTGALEARLALAELVDTVEAIRAVWANSPVAAELHALLGDVGETASKSGAALHEALSRCERYLAGGPHLHLDVESGEITEP
jgi:hypothetical protein